MKSLKEYRRYLRPAALALGAAAFLIPSSAFAADTGIVDGINFLLKFISILLTPFVYMAGWLLSPSWTMGDVIGLRPHLHGMWVLVSNIVYTIFALALLGIAFVNIFNVGGEKGKYELKAMLPKFVVGILIVPFSWFAVSATLSVANLLTASVLQLPASVIPNAPASMSGVFIPALITLDFSAKSTAATGAEAPGAAGTSTGYVQTADCSLAANQTQGEGRKCVPVYEAITGQGTYSPLVYYVYGIFHIQDSQILKEGGLKGIATLADLAMSVAIELLLIVVLFVVVLALFAALAVRAVVLWAYIIFSPVFGLMYFLDGSFKFADKVAEKVSFGKFLSLAMVPVYVSAALAFGIIFLNSATNFGGGKEISGDGITLKAENGGATFSNGPVTIVMKGGEGAADAKRLVDYGLGRLLFSGFALVILYLSVMAALKANEITGMVVEPIDKLAKIAAKTTPILPGGQSISSVKGAAGVLETSMNSRVSAQLEPLRGVSNKFFGVSTANVQDVTRLKEALQTGLRGQSDLDVAQDKVKSIARSVTGGTANPEFRKHFEQYVTTLQNSGTALGNSLKGKKIEEFIDSGGNLTALGVGALEDNLQGDGMVDRATQLRVASELRAGSAGASAKGGTKSAAILSKDQTDKLRLDVNKVADKQFISVDGNKEILIEINENQQAISLGTAVTKVAADGYGISDEDAGKLVAASRSMSEPVKAAFAKKLGIDEKDAKAFWDAMKQKAGGGSTTATPPAGTATPPPAKP